MAMKLHTSLILFALITAGVGDWEDYNVGIGNSNSNGSHECSILVESQIHTNMILSGVEFTVVVTLPGLINDSMPLPAVVYYWLVNLKEGDVIVSNSYSRINKTGSSYTIPITATLYSSGHHDVQFIFSSHNDLNDTSGYLCTEMPIINFLAIPGIVTLLPPILTAFIAIAFRQVLMALLLGIWLCAFFVYRYNPMVATLRTVDKYFVESVADFGHAQIAVFSFFLGGLIGVVQKSGGGLGLASLLKKFTGSRRRAIIACMILGSFIFFDDYTLVLITGTSLRMMMKTALVSKEKYAYILKSLAPTLPNLAPISSWIGVEVGNLRSALNTEFCQSCDELKDADAFVLTVSTIPYRFFPLLVIFTALVIAFLNRDFGPLLKAEQAMVFHQPVSSQSQQVDQNVLSEEEECDSKEELLGNHETERVETRENSQDGDNDLQVEYTGPLAPKKGIKYRWYNAAIPFIIAMVVTLIGMVLDGYVFIKNMPESKRVPMTIINIFSKADAIAALIWASVLACVVSLMMLLIQRALTLQEYMNSWIEGLKDIIEPFVVLWLAWALGAAIQDVQTSNYLAKTLSDGGFSVHYVPVFVTLIGFAMSFAAGSAFGTMGIIFPLIIPTVCKLSCSKLDVIQSSAAIIGSSIFGNIISPMAGICILTVFASECELVPHIKTSALYSLIIATVSVLFGALPVGAGWYPWYVGWAIMAAIIVVIFVLFSSNPDSCTSQSLIQRYCPGVYTVPTYFYRVIKRFLDLVVGKSYRKLKYKVISIKFRIKARNSVSLDVSDEHEYKQQQLLKT